jgi:hypothetical protein
MTMIQFGGRRSFGEIPLPCFQEPDAKCIYDEKGQGLGRQKVKLCRKKKIEIRDG